MFEQRADSFDVSPQQERLWLAEPEGPSSRVQGALTLSGPLDAEALASALGRVVKRHEILRTSFVRQPGIRIPLQVIHDDRQPSWAGLDLRAVAPSEQSSRVLQARQQALEDRFDFSSSPLLRALLISGDEDQHTLVLTVSSLCADAASLTLIVRELALEYGGGQLVEDPLQYADFSAWQRELESSEEDEARGAGEFWNALQDACSPSLPFERHASAAFLPAEVMVEIDTALSSAIETQAGRYGATPAGFVQAAWHALLSRLSGEDAVIGYLGVERRHADLEGAIGAFSRPVPIRTRTGAGVTFAEVLSEVVQAREDALVWQDYAPSAGLERLRIGYLAHDPYSEPAGGIAWSLADVTVTGLQFRLWLTCAEGSGPLKARLCFDPESLDGETVKRVARQLKLLLGGAAADAGTALAGLPLLDDSDRQRLLVGFSGTSSPIPDACVHELIAAQAAASPARDAVVDERGAISYSELDTRANQLAQRLRRAGVGPDVGVGLCTDRSVDMVVGLLGILKAGGAYVPLHYEHPPARLAQQLSAAGARALVTQEALLGSVPEFAGEVICLDRDRAGLDAEPGTAPEVGVANENLVYVTYTSGSTGTPKGVGVTHRNLVNYASHIAAELGANREPMSFGVVTSISTDLGNTSVYGALCSGGTLVLVSPSTAADPAALAAQFERTPVDVLKITPSHAGALLAGGDPGVLPRRWLVIGGERAPWDLIERVREVSDCGILNHYGPTETTVGCCTYPVGDGPEQFQPATVPIGRPIANTSCYILDELSQLTPIGVAGRLYVGGSGVARGYVGQEELTSERFLPDPFAGAAGARMYDTGDVARWLPDGKLEFLGRVDEQVKIRGYRVEPAEVETALRSHAEVHDAVVVAHVGAAGDARLVAYCAVSGAVSQEDLRAHLAQWLPEFMIPSAIARLEQLPRTPSGKIDRLALPDPETPSDATAEYVAPGSPMEEAVAAIWSQVLGVEQVGVEEDFFALGGHSLLATQVVAQVRSDFAVDLPLHSLFTYPTVASLTGEIVRMMGDSEGEETARLMAELEGLSDEEAERLLAAEPAPPDSRPRA
jgi:amino acid adenylation domain-containing protein